jgi:hypothetical protein
MTTDPFTAAGAPPTGRGQAEDRGDGVPRDHNGGYVLPNLDGSPPLTYKNGNPIGRVRASTIKSVTTDKTGIQKWQKEMVVRGLAKDANLVTEAMKATAADDKTRIREIGERAFKVGGGKVAADRGSEFHEVTEKIKKGEQITPDQISDKIVARDVDAYLQVLAEVNLKPVPGMQERVVLLDHGGGGTFDDMFEWYNPDTESYELLIGDTKTGADIWKYGSLEIIVQMVQYTRALAIWRAPKDGGAEPWGDYIPMPNVSKHHVAIVHAPQNGTAEAFIVDITGAQEVVDAALTIRRWRSDAKHRVRSIGRVDLREEAFVAPAANNELTNQTRQALNLPVRPAAAGMAKGPDLSQPDGVWKPAGVAATGAAFAPMIGEQVRQATADQIEQERIRDARLTKLSEAMGPNTEGDDEQPAISPDTGRKRRACGYCRKPGHTQKNCPQNPDSPKYQVPGIANLSPAEIQSMDQHAAAAPALNGDVPTLAQQVDQEMSDGDHDTRSSAVRAVATRTQIEEQIKLGPPEGFVSLGGVPGAVRGSEAEYVMFGDSLPRETVTEQSAFGAIDVERQYCPGTHNAGWTQRPDMPGLSVCASCNLPTRLHAEAMARARSRTQAAYAEPTPGLTINGQPAASYRPQPVDLISQSIAQAQTQPEVLNIRQASIDAGRWSEQYEREARERYEAIVPAWGTQ